MTEAKEKSPNAAIDKAMKKLMDDMDKTDASPDQLKARTAVLQAAMKWEQIKHNIKDGEDFNPDNI